MNVFFKVYIMFSVYPKTFLIHVNSDIVLFHPIQTQFEISIQISNHIEILGHFGSTDTNLHSDTTVAFQF